MPPILILREHADRVEQHRARFARLFVGVPVSAAWAVADLLQLGVGDLQGEIIERGGGHRVSGARGAATTPTIFTAPSPPRGSRWGPRGHDPSAAFVRLSATWIPSGLADDLHDLLRAFRKIAPGVVLSRAALIREALTRAIARLDAQHEMLTAIEGLSQGSLIPPSTTVIRLASPILPRGRPPKVARKRTPTRRTRKRAVRSKARRRSPSRSRDDPDPAPAPPQDLGGAS